MSGLERPASGFVRRAGLYYLLASTYLVARLVLNRVLLGIWGLSVELGVDVLLVAAAQTAVIELVRIFEAAGANRKQRVGGAPEAGH